MDVLEQKTRPAPRDGLARPAPGLPSDRLGQEAPAEPAMRPAMVEEAGGPDREAAHLDGAAPVVGGLALSLGVPPAVVAHGRRG